MTDDYLMHAGEESLGMLYSRGFSINHDLTWKIAGKIACVIK